MYQHVSLHTYTTSFIFFIKLIFSYRLILFFIKFTSLLSTSCRTVWVLSRSDFRSKTFKDSHVRQHHRVVYKHCRHVIVHCRVIRVSVFRCLFLRYLTILRVYPAFPFLHRTRKHARTPSGAAVRFLEPRRFHGFLRSVLSFRLVAVLFLRRPLTAPRTHRLCSPTRAPYTGCRF